MEIKNGLINVFINPINYTKFYFLSTLGSLVMHFVLHTKVHYHFIPLSGKTKNTSTLGRTHSSIVRGDDGRIGVTKELNVYKFSSSSFQLHFTSGKIAVAQLELNCNVSTCAANQFSHFLQYISNTF